MATKRVIPDKDFGQIIIRTRTTARNISMRTKPDGLHVTVPPYSLTSRVLKAIEEFRPRLVHAVMFGVLLVWAVLSFSGVATFIYSNF